MIYPIGIQNFESLINDGYMYVDKTALVYQMTTTGRYYFLSRPRRFGKSLLLSTLEAYLSGKKELFKGLAIEKLEHKWEEIYGTFPTEVTFALRLKGIVERAYEKTSHRVVIFVDEYDKPMLQAIGNELLQTEYRSTLKAFYSVLKTQDRYIKLAFLTGVTKFGKVSVFSDLNNLNDISMDDRYINICGITDRELHEYFDNDVALLGERNGLTKEECYTKLKEQYDGYHFDCKTEGLYNPFSILNTLAKMKFANYWFEIGTPSFLVYLMKNSNYQLDKLTEEQVSGDFLNSIDSMSRNPIPVIYQSGYLTIKGYNEEFDIYRLGFPNKEVESGFIKYLIPFYTPEEEKTGFFITNFIMDIRRGAPESFMQRM